MKKITLILILLLVSSFSYGQIVAWSMVSPNTTGDEVTLDARTLDPNLNMSTLRRGSGINPDGLARAFSSISYTVGGTQTDAITNNDYLEFDISATPTYQVSLSTLDVNFRRSNAGPNTFLWRYSTDGINFTDIGTPFTYTVVGGGGTPQTQIDLSSIPALQNVASGTTITFRLYGWGATFGTGTFAIGRLDGDELSIGGSVTALPCPGGTVTWNGSWSGTPSLTTEVVIASNYDTSAGSFSACSLTVDTGVTLNISNGTFVEVENDVIVDGNLTVQSQGNFVQNDSGGTFTLNGSSSVIKNTPVKADWFYYTYWSSPVVGETIGNVFFDVDGDRRFWFNAANFEDTDGDDIDDNDDDWQYALSADVMTPGVGYATTSGRLGIYPSARVATFNGAFNTGDISTSISYNAANVVGSWNFIGNPYPSAIDFIAFQGANSSVIDGAAYFWSQSQPPSEANPGNQGLNFNQNDYATFTIGTGGAAGASGVIPNQYIPSGQGFFISGLANGNVTFTNAIRMADGTSNSQFFKNSSNSKSNLEQNKLWLNLTTKNGVFNQILIGYVDGASNGDDGLIYDAPRIVNQDFNSVLYSLINESNRKFVVQGKASNSLDTDEIIKLGFKTSMDVVTTYTLSIAQLQGDFLSSNTVYLKDNLTNTVHNLSDSNYNFTSEVGEFNDRFEIAFSAAALSNDEFTLSNRAIKIVQLDDNNVQFTTENSTFKSIVVFDLLGRTLYKLNGDSTNETYNLSTLKSSVYIANIELANGATISKKFIKR